MRRQGMVAVRDAQLLRIFRLCRADIITALGSRLEPPTQTMLRELAELQLAIMATEGAIADKANPDFAREFQEKAAA
jgi:hypothetical protein